MSVPDVFSKGSSGPFEQQLDSGLAPVSGVPAPAVKNNISTIAVRLFSFFLGCLVVLFSCLALSFRFVKFSLFCWLLLLFFFFFSRYRREDTGSVAGGKGRVPIPPLYTHSSHPSASGAACSVPVSFFEYLAS